MVRHILGGATGILQETKESDAHSIDKRKTARISASRFFPRFGSKCEDSTHDTRIKNLTITFLSLSRLTIIHYDYASWQARPTVPDKLNWEVKIKLLEKSWPMRKLILWPCLAKPKK